MDQGLPLIDKRSRKSAFDLFEYFIGLHSAMVYADKRLLHVKVSTASKIGFNAEIRHLKDLYGLDTEDMKRAMLYMYVYNPLTLPVAQYGNIDSLKRSLVHYCRWKKENEDTLQNIIATAPAVDKWEHLLDDWV